MSYTPTNWQTGDTITADKLNNIEDGILGVETDVSQLKSAIGQLDSEVYDVNTDEFTYSVGSGLTRTSPWMGTEKYGVKVNKTLSALSFAFNLPLRYTTGTTITFKLKDASGTVYATETETYTVATSGDNASVSISFTFNNLLQAGQYYLWIYSDTASSIGYGYSSGTFPSYTYITLTNDGGYAGAVDATNLNSYAMYLNVAISGTSVEVISKIETLENEVTGIYPLTISQPSIVVEQNRWDVLNGNPAETGNCCRTVGYVTRGQAIITKVPYVMQLLAYDKTDTYVGYWKLTEFSKSYNPGTDFIYTSQVFDIDDFATRFPDYKFKLNFLTLPTTAFTPEILASNVKTASKNTEQIYSKNLGRLIDGFTDVGVCGDSLCIGTTTNSGGTVKTGEQWSWVKRLAVRSGNTWETFAKAGLTTATWLTDDAGLPALQATNKKQMYIVALGVNDATGDYESTLTTNYGALIDAIHTAASDAIIMCLPTWSFASSRPTDYNKITEIIKTVCSTRSYAFPVDLSGADYVLKDTYFSVSRVSAHYNSLAYSMIADVIAYGIGKVIYDNPDSFKYIDFIDVT